MPSSLVRPAWLARAYSLECLDDARVEHVLLVSRHPIDVRRPHGRSARVALITRAASGIGKAVALKLASGGTSVVISGRRQDLGNDAVAEISAAAASGAPVRFIRNDVTYEHAVKAMINGIVAEFGRLDMTVNKT